jgi:hypothetical protein
LTFKVSRDHGRIPDWDQATIHGAGDFEVTKARIHYAQSYALVSALIGKFGAVKVADYRAKFWKVFGIET